MFKLDIKTVILIVLFMCCGLFTTTTVQASAYKVTSTQNITPTPYYLTSYTKTRYSWNKTHTKKLTVLNSFMPDDEYVVQKLIISHNGKETAYFHLKTYFGRDLGYVTTQGFRQGYNPKGDEKIPYKDEWSTRSTKKERRTIALTSKKAFAKATKKIGEYHFYRTTKKMTFNTYFQAYLEEGDVTFPITLPAGTIVQANVDNGSIQFSTTLLSQKILTPGYRAGLWIGPETVIRTENHAKIKNFKRVKRPAYFPKNKSNGDFYVGSLRAIQYKGSLLSKQSVQITTDGYVEVRRNNPEDRAIVYGAKPITSVKIKRTRIKDHTRYLYLAKKMKGFKTTKVQYNGKHQYRLALVNLQKTYATPAYLTSADDVGYIRPSDYYGIMHLGGKTFYTPYGPVPYDY